MRWFNSGKIKKIVFLDMCKFCYEPAGKNHRCDVDKVIENFKEMRDGFIKENEEILKSWQQRGFKIDELSKKLEEKNKRIEELRFRRYEMISNEGK